MNLTLLKTAGLLGVVLAACLAPERTDAAQVAAQADAPACIAIVLPSATGADGDATGFATALRELFASFLTGPSLRTIPLDARLASQAVEEARQKECGFMLLTSIARKRDGGSGWGQAVGRAAGTAAWYGVPYGTTAGAAAARGATIAGAQAIGAMAQSTRARDEVTLEYRVGPPDAAIRMTPKVEKAKASRDGEDLLTPLVEKASESIVATVQRK